MHADYRKHMQQAWLPECPKTLEGLKLLFEKGREKSIEIHESQWLAKEKNYGVISKTQSFGQWNEVFDFYLMK